MSREQLDGPAVVLIAVSAMAVGTGAALGFIPGFVATEIRADLGVSRGQVGLIVSVYFGCTGLGSVLGGRVTEVLGARMVVVIDMLLVATAALFTAIVGTYWALLVAGLVAGTGYSLANAGTNVAIGRVIPADRRTMAMAIKTAGVPVMAAITAGGGPWAAQRWSWQAMWFTVATVAAVAAIAAFKSLPADRPEKAKRSVAVLPNGIMWFPIGAFFLVAGTQPLYSWTVAYLEESLDASPLIAGGVSSAASIIGIGAMVFSAFRADRFGASNRIPWMMFLLGIASVATFLVLAGEKMGVGVVAIGVIIGISAQLSAIGIMHATIVDRAPSAVARATGLTMTGYYIGALASPFLFGVIADATGTFGWSWLGTGSLLCLAIPCWAFANRIPISAAEESSELAE